MTMEKIVGFTLLALGISIILYSLYSSYAIFTGKSMPPQIFSATEKSIRQDEIQKAIEEQLSNLLPKDSVPQMLNLVSWSMLAGIFLFGGSQISALGIKMIKKQTP